MTGDDSSAPDTESPTPRAAGQDAVQAADRRSRRVEEVGRVGSTVQSCGGADTDAPTELTGAAESQGTGEALPEKSSASDSELGPVHSES